MGGGRIRRRADSQWRTELERQLASFRWLTFLFLFLLPLPPPLKLCLPVCQYPAILDYWQGVRELDEVFYTSASQRTAGGSGPVGLG